MNWIYIVFFKAQKGTNNILFYSESLPKTVTTFRVYCHHCY